jgi:hypothetical protein
VPFVFALWVLRAGADPGRVLPCCTARALAAASSAGRTARTAAAHYDLDADDVRGVQRFWQEGARREPRSGAIPASSRPDPAPR